MTSPNDVQAPSCQLLSDCDSIFYRIDSITVINIDPEDIRFDSTRTVATIKKQIDKALLQSKPANPDNPSRPGLHVSSNAMIRSYFLGQVDIYPDGQTAETAFDVHLGV